MLKQSRIFSVFVSAAAAASMLTVMAPFAMAESSHELSESAVTSTRAFPKVTNVRRDILTESTSTDVDANSHWGGIESLNVPQTKTLANKLLKRHAVLLLEMPLQAVLVSAVVLSRFLLLL